MIASLLAAALAASPAPSAPSVTATAASGWLLALAPEDALAVLALDELDRLRDETRRNAWFRFGRDEQVAALTDPYLAGALDQLEREADLAQALGDDFDPGALVESLHGSLVAFSALPPDANPDGMLLGLLLELGEDRSGFDDLLGRLLERAGDGVEADGFEHAGAHLTVFRPAGADDAGERAGVVLAELGDTIAIVGGPDRELATDRAREIVDRWAGRTEGGGLLQSLSFAEARASAGFAPDVELYVSLERLWEALERTGQWGHDVPVELRRELAAVRWFHGAANLGPGEEADFSLALSAPREGLVHSFHTLFGGIPLYLLDAIPRHSVRVSTSNLDLLGLHALFLDLVRTFDPDAMTEVEGLLESARAAGVDPVKDVLSVLTGGTATFTVEVPSSESVTGMAGNLLASLNGVAPTTAYGSACIVGLSDAARLEQVVDRLVAARGAELHRVIEADGRRIHAIGNPGLVALHWAFVPQGVVLALQPTPVREALRMLDEGAPSILEKRRFADVIDRNRGASFFCITETAESMRSALGGLRWTATVLPFVAAMYGQRLPDDLPFGPETQWPDPAIAGRYFEGTVSTALTWDEGSLRWRLSSR